MDNMGCRILSLIILTVLIVTMSIGVTRLTCNKPRKTNLKLPIVILWNYGIFVILCSIIAMVSAAAVFGAALGGVASYYPDLVGWSMQASLMLCPILFVSARAGLILQIGILPAVLIVPIGIDIVSVYASHRAFKVLSK